jgi:hypothetical protein
MTGEAELADRARRLVTACDRSQFAGLMLDGGDGVDARHLAERARELFEALATHVDATNDEEPAESGIGESLAEGAKSHERHELRPE